jgi:tRNA uridine 5-carboxymethylaminomethyl modification enzyme
MFSTYDVIVVGGGHAGCEAAAAAANLGSHVLLISMNLQNMGQMSCNPAVGGIAKGQIVREIDALGGFMGIVTDAATIQFRMLNRSKGPGMWSPRAQCDRMLFAETWRTTLESIPNLHLWQDQVLDLIVSRGTISGVRTQLGHDIQTKTVIVTAGTFLNGKIHIGRQQFGGGRIGEGAARGLTESLEQLGMVSSRLKTGTPPRIDGRSLDYSKMEMQAGDIDPQQFSYMGKSAISKKSQLPCWITYTNPEVHATLEEGFVDSPMFSGAIEGSGPRYCPSIEDKISRFADKSQHQLFIEPEGWHTNEVYVNGFSTSLPQQTQFDALRKVPGFEKCLFLKPGYAIEYDFFQPTQLKSNLETKAVSGLFCAGQINGTTGYEEAGCQGLMAGINAHLQVKGKGPFTLGRDEAYIGVLIDDLISKGTEEPYRMFTSRAEYRTLLRQDNADLRLTEKSYNLGLAKEERLQKVNTKQDALKELHEELERAKIDPETYNLGFEEGGFTQIAEKIKVSKLLLRPGIGIDILAERYPMAMSFVGDYEMEVREQAEIQIKYDTYIKKEAELAQRMRSLENMPMPANIVYADLKALSHEARQKLDAVKPETLGQASRISGVNPADIQVLMIHFGR